jgi:hypothetical protein
VPYYLDKPEARTEYIRPDALLPYGLTPEEICTALDRVYDMLHIINSALVGKGFDRLEDMLLGNTFAGILSELIVKSVALSSEAVVANEQVGGFPDLLPAETEEIAVLQGVEGIEIKASKQEGGWQGHNPEQGWYMICRYIIDTDTLPVAQRRPTEIVEVLAAQLSMEDWSFSGRRAGSRRTPTASILAAGRYKLRQNAVYVHPEFTIPPKAPRGYKPLE